LAISGNTDMGAVLCWIFMDMVILSTWSSPCYLELMKPLQMSLILII